MDLADEMFFFNPWWRENLRLPRLEGLIQRKTYKKLEDSLEQPFISVITGLRRVGKTTILRQMIQNLLATGVAKENILFFSFEESIVKQSPSVLEEILNLYFSRVLKKRVHSIDEKVYICKFSNLII